jgi:nucleotide-binding universal stress UspA family protein
MKIVIGVDDKGRAKDLSDMLQALRFPDVQLDVVHVLESWGSTPVQPPRSTSDLVSRYVKMRHDNAKELLESVRLSLGQRGFATAKPHLLSGFISNALLDHADQAGADIVAVTASGKTPIEGAMIGSVSRKAVISARRSVLIAKRPVQPSRRLTVVLATDHSAYANRCIDVFARWAPQGIGRVVVATIYPEQLVRAMASVMDNFKADVNGWIRAELESSNQQVIRRLSGLGAECVSRIETGFVNDAIEKIMTEERADLLVLGAQGHGFVERFVLGSVALEQAVKKPYSTLIVRA